MNWPRYAFAAVAIVAGLAGIHFKVEGAGWVVFVGCLVAL